MKYTKRSHVTQDCSIKWRLMLLEGTFLNFFMKLKYLVSKCHLEDGRTGF